MRIGVVQLSVSDDPAANLPQTIELIEAAAADGATAIFTPEVTNLICTDRRRQAEILHPEETDPTLAALQEVAAKNSIWLHIGSLALKGGAEGKFFNRGFVVDPSGQITARYDKIHLFDVSISNQEIYKESSAYHAGNAAVVADMEGLRLGMSICYDIRFPHLYRDLALAGAEILAVPGAFSITTGPAQIETLLKARAIESGVFVVMAAQTGLHRQASGKTRETWGHSMVISPWGKKICDLGVKRGVSCMDIDFSQVAEARAKIPSLLYNPEYSKP